MIQANARLIRVRMAELEFTRQDLAKEAGITDATLRRIMSGDDCKISTLASIANVLGIQSDEILIINQAHGEPVAA